MSDWSGRDWLNLFGVLAIILILLAPIIGPLIRDLRDKDQSKWYR